MTALLPPPRPYTLTVGRRPRRPVTAQPQTTERLDQECEDCGVFFIGPLAPDNLCGSNCRAIRAEIAADDDPRDSYPMDTLRAMADTIDERPQIESLRIDFCGGSKVLSARFSNRNFDSREDFDLALSQIRGADAYMVKVYARLTIAGGDTYTFRPDQYCQQAKPGEGRSDTIYNHFAEYAARLREMAESGQPHAGQTPAEMLARADAYQVVLAAMGG